METTEKIASLYLRLNSFFLMPQFTVFIRKKQRHVDVLGVRLRNSTEEVNGTRLAIDEEFIEMLDGFEEDVYLWSEVGTGRSFPEEKEAYCRKIFGGPDTLKKVYFDFRKDRENLQKGNDDILVVPAGRCKKFILERFAQMESEPVRSKLKRLTNVTKEGSWSWSEQFLADMLYLRKKGFLREGSSSPHEER